MKRINGLISGLMVGGLVAGTALAGEATTSANAGTTYGGKASATANWNGDGGNGFSRTRTQTGDVNLARGVAFGVDKDGMDLSFSHAIAPKLGPAYAGTFHLSIGTDGQVSGSYGGVVSKGGLVRSAEAGGTTSSRTGAATAVARGDTAPGGSVQARTHSYTVRPAPVQRPVRYRPVARYGR